jgi:hypothetical protein
LTKNFSKHQNFIKKTNSKLIKGFKLSVNKSLNKKWLDNSNKKPLQPDKYSKYTFNNNINKIINPDYKTKLKTYKYLPLNNGFTLKRIDYSKNNNYKTLEVKLKNQNLQKKLDDKKIEKNEKQKKKIFISPIIIPLIKKPNRSFITKKFKYKKIKKEYLTNKNPIKKTSYFYTLLPEKILNEHLKIQKLKRAQSNSLFCNSTNKLITKINCKPKKISPIKQSNNYASLLFNSNDSKIKNFIKVHELSPYIEIRKEVNINLNKKNGINIEEDNKSNSLNKQNNQNNSDFVIQKTCQIESLMNIDKKEDKKKEIIIEEKNENKIEKRLENKKIEKKIRQKLLFDNINFSQDLQELKTAIEFSETYKNYITNSINTSNFDNMKSKIKNMTKRYLILSKHRKINSLSSKNIKQEDNNQFFLNKNFVCSLLNEETKINKSLEFKRHFNNEQICPICTSLRENYKLREKKSNNHYYYFAFKDKSNSSHSNLYNFRTTNNNNGLVSNISQELLKTDNYTNFISIRMRDRMKKKNQFQPFHQKSNAIIKKDDNHRKVLKGKKRFNSTKMIREDNLYQDLEALKSYFGN